MGRVKTDKRLERERIEAEIAQRRAQTAEHVAAATRHGVAAAIEGGISVGLAAWAYYRMGATLGREELLRGTGLYPGIKAWISDEIGLIVGPMIAPALPKDLHDNGAYLADRHLEVDQAGQRDWPPESQALITASIVRERWYVPVWGPPRPQNPPDWAHLMGLRLTDETRLMIASATTIAGVALVEGAKAAGVALAKKVVP